MSHLRLVELPTDEPTRADGAERFATFTPMNEQPSLADRKASFVMGAGGLMLSTLLFFVMPLQQFARPGLWPASILVVSLSVACLILLAVRIAFVAYTARVSVEPHNLMFVENVGNGPFASYSQSIKRVTSDDVLHDQLSYNHAMAALGTHKYRLVCRALDCLRIAIPLWMLVLLVVSVKHS